LSQKNTSKNKAFNSEYSSKFPIISRSEVKKILIKNKILDGKKNFVKVL